MCRSPDVILITETRIQEAPAVNIEMQGYNLKFANSPIKAGGVAMYFTQDINFEIAPEYNLEIEGCENMWATISTPQHKLLIGVIYRHPNSNLNSFLENFDLTLRKINKNKSQSIIMGDFNVNLLNETPFVTDYKNTIARNAFFSVVNIPTRVTETTKTAIDHILTNITSEEIKPGVLQTDISDHFPTFAYIS